MRLPESLGPLGEREFRLLFLARITSFAGTAMAPVALAFAVLDKTDDASALGIVLAARSIPQLVFLLVGGVVSDRLPRNVVMVGADVLSGTAQVVAGGLVLSGSFEIWQLAALAACQGAASAFFFPASQGVVPETVSAARLQQANVLLRMGTNATFIGSPALGGVLVATIGPGWALVFDGGSYLVSAAILLAMRLPPRVRTAATSVLHDLREGWTEFRSRTWLWVIVLAFGFLNAAHSGATNVLAPVVAKRDLGGPEAYGIMVAGGAVGLVLGGLLLFRWRPGRILLVACCGVMLELPLLVLLAVPAPLPVLFAAALLGGMGVEIFGIFWDMALQQNIPRDALSRVYSYDALGSFVLIPVGLSAAGPAAEWLGVDGALLGAAAVIAAGAVAMLAVPDVRRIRRAPEAEPLSPLAAGTGERAPVLNRLGPLAEQNFRLLFFARTASEIGSTIAPVALAFAVLDELDGTATDIGLVLAAASVPQVLFLLVGGVWADRLPRNLVLVATDLTMFGAQAVVAALLLTDSAELWHLLVTQAIRGTAQAFFFPASTGLVPQTISAPLLQPANALLRLSHSSTGVLGAAAGGGLVAAFGSAYAIGFDALTFLASAALLVRMRLPRQGTVPVRNFARELREGWDEFWSRTWLWAIVLAALIDNAVFSGAFSVLGPVVADERLGGAAAWGAILAALAAGFVAGGLVMLRVRPKRPMLVACAGLVPLAAPLVLLALEANVVLVAAAALLAGIGLEVFGVLWDTALQQHVPQDRLSRVSAYDFVGSFVAVPIGLTLAGTVSDAIGREEILLGAATVITVTVILLFLVRDIRTMRADPAAPLTPVPTPSP